MTSIIDVPLEDIKSFLKNNNIKIFVKDKDDYAKAFDLIVNGKGVGYPDSIIDWIIAHNLANSDKEIKHYTRGEIDLMNDKELQKLADSLEIYDSPNVKQSVINVLKYLHKLDISIVHPDIDPYIFRTLEELDERKILSSGYNDIIKIFSKNKLLRKFIHDNMEQIIKINAYDEDYGGYNISTNENVGEGDLVNFIVDLMKMKEITLAKEALKISNNLLTDDNRFYLVADINSGIMHSGDEQLIENYFKLRPYIRELYPEEYIDDEGIIEAYEDNIKGVSLKDYRNDTVPFFAAAIKAKYIPFIDYFINIWGAERNYYKKPDAEGQLFVDDMDQLVKEAKLI